MEEDFSKYNAHGTVLRKAQLRMLDILIEIDKICKKHDIPYWLDFGTLLGAVRHKGFIPWDDDLDIGVFRKDYKKLLKILKAELPDQFFVQDENNERHYPYRWNKVIDKKSFIESLENIPIENKGLFVDIFPFEPGNAKLKKFVEIFYGRAFRRIRMYGAKEIKVPLYEFIISLISWPFLVVIVSFVRLISKMLTPKMNVYSYGIGLFVPHSTSTIIPLKKIEFEGEYFSSPFNPDEYLKAIYGDYMQIPAEDKRIIHSTRITFLD